MSATAPVRAGAAPRQVPARQRPAKPRLEVVPPVASPRGRVAFVILVGGILAGGLVSLLMLHTLAAQDAFTVHKLQRHATALTELEQQLAVADQQAQAPSVLAARARALGLVPTTGLRFVRRKDGTVVAVATAAPPPAVVGAPTPAATPSASASTSAAKATKPSQAKHQVKTKSTASVHRARSHHG